MNAIPKPKTYKQFLNKNSPSTEWTFNIIYTPEMIQDISIFGGIDLEAELTTLFTEQLAANIDRDIITRILNITHEINFIDTTFTWGFTTNFWINKNTSTPKPKKFKFDDYIKA